MNKQHFAIGLVFILIIIIVLGKSYRSDSYSIDNINGYILKARFSDIGGLANGAEVQLAGVKVGVVVAQQFDVADATITVTMDMISNIAIPLDSSIAVIGDGIFGGKFLSISPGADYDPLEAGDFFDYSRNAINVMGIMEKVIIAAEKKVSRK